MVGLIHRRIAPGGRLAVRMFEARRGIVIFRLEYDVDAPAQVTLHRLPIASKRRDHLDHAVAGQCAAEMPRAQDASKIVGAAWGKPKPSCGTPSPQAFATAASRSLTLCRRGTS